MISDVFVSGRLGKQIDKDYRYLLLERPLVNHDGHFQVDKIPVRVSYFGSESFMKEKEGTLIVFKGRIEMDDRFGLCLVVEHRESFAPRMELTNAD